MLYANIKQSKMNKAASILLTFFTIIYLNLFGQSTIQEAEVLKESISELNYKLPIIYVKKYANSSKRNELIDKIKYGKFFLKINEIYDPDSYKTTESEIVDSLILTKSEIDYIIGKLVQNISWKKDLFDSSILVNNYQEGNNYIKLLESKNPTYNKERKYYVFTFIKPIFIRNNSVCLAIFAADHGQDCPIVKKAFYRKTGNNWKEWIPLF